MGKYKNDFEVIGSKSLLAAFIEELKTLGYSKSDSREYVSDRINVYGWNGFKEGKSTYAQHGKFSNEVYELPTQWNLALKKASELYVEERIIKDGDWVKWTDGNLYKLKRISGDNYNMLSWHSTVGFTECKDYYVNLIRDKSTPVTSEEIKEWLIKYFNTLGYEYSDRFLALRDTVKDEFEDCSDYKCDKAGVGRHFAYNPVTDTLYNLGYNGRFVVYERGQWINRKGHFPKLHNYSPIISDVNVQYGCKVVKKNAIKKLNQMIEDFNKDSDVKITSVEFDDYLVDTKNIKIITQNI